MASAGGRVQPQNGRPEAPSAGDRAQPQNLPPEASSVGGRVQPESERPDVPSAADTALPETTVSTVQPRRVLGVDGCPAGWVTVRLIDGVVDDVEVVETLDAALESPYDAVAIDMPIGLLQAPRGADQAARQVLGHRASSVFSTPPRAVVSAWTDGSVTEYAQANALATETIGSGISQQAWRLVPKIAEVDRHVAAGAPLHEVHPEVAFAIVVGAALPRKRSWAGFTTRRAVLERYELMLPERFTGDDAAAPDDVLDAAICAWVADGIASGAPTLSIPEGTQQTDRGRPVVMTARIPPPVTPGPRRPRA